MAGLAYGLARGMEAWLGTAGLTAQLAGGLLPVAVAAPAYLGIARALGVPEAASIVGALARLRGSGR
jgi:hypothetical protein